MSAHQLYFHLAWATRDRAPMIDAATRDFLEEFFRRTATRERAEIVALAILRTHVHMLLRTSPRIDLPRLTQFFKGGSSYAASRLTRVRRLRRHGSHAEACARTHNAEAKSATRNILQDRASPSPSFRMGTNSGKH